MAKKSKSKKIESPRKKSVGESLGVSGFTLGIVSLVILFLSPLLGIVISITGFVFCLKQQKTNPTKLGKAGLIINSVGFVLSLVWVYLLIEYIYPYMLEQQLEALQF